MLEHKITMTADNTLQILQDDVPVPKSMAEALDWEDPGAALRAISRSSQEKAVQLAEDLRAELETYRLDLPEILKTLREDHPVNNATACADSIFHTLTKIASGGSQASQEIRQLENEKQEMEEHAAAIQTALMLRKNSDRCLQAMQTHQYAAAADSIRPWLDWKQDDNSDPRIRAYAGEYCLQQLANTYIQLRESLLKQYEVAVGKGDLQILGQLTPVLGKIQLEKEAVQLYLQFLKTNLESSIKDAWKQQETPKGQSVPPPYAPMARIFNIAVACLRHHLPMVSHYLHRADGDAAVLQLVHVQVEESVLPLLDLYQNDRQLQSVSRNAQRIYAALEERYTGRSLVDESENDEDDDCGFSVHIGSLVDTDGAMEETALCIQHTESYLRFIQHTCQEVNKARKFRFERAQRQAKLERERQEWASGKGSKEEDEEDEYATMEILPSSTPLHEAVAELGGQYASIERCLLLASMQRAFVAPDTSPKYYRPLSTSKLSSSKALQTSVVETCMYAARRGTHRAFATGHTGTASAATNFCADCLTGVLVEVLSHRAEESGVALLKPGEGLLVGSAGIFNASNLIRQGTQVAKPGHPKDGLIRQQQLNDGVAKACAIINDLEVAAHHVEQLESTLAGAIEKGFPPDTHDTEQLKLCVKAFGPVRQSFIVASDGTIESLESVLRQRVRTIVGEAVGGEGSSAAAFMGSSVMVGGKGTDKTVVRINYNLDEDSYNLMQLGEGYIARMCSLLDELFEPLRTYLAPRLWDNLLLQIISTAAKRLETSLKKCVYTALGGLALDSDMRDLLSFTKERLNGTEYGSNLAVIRACSPLARLLQISKLLSVDDVEDVLDLVSSHKRKGNWDLKLEETKYFLSQRVEFESSKINDLLRLPDDD